LYSALRWGTDDGWNAQVESTWVSRVPVTTASDEAAPAYALFGFNTGYVWNVASWRVNAFARVDNIASRPYVGSVIINDANGRFAEPGPSRSVFAGIDLRWRS